MNIHDKNKFNIDLNVLSNWLGMRKTNLFRTLIKTYRQDIDYIFLSQSQSGSNGGRPRKNIMITVECCKRLCMLSKSPNCRRSSFIFLTC